MSISFAQQIFVTYYEPGTSPGTGDTALTKTNKKSKPKQKQQKTLLKNLHSRGKYRQKKQDE